MSDTYLSRWAAKLRLKSPPVATPVPEVQYKEVPVCPMWASDFSVESMSSRSEVTSYLVRFVRLERPFCSCPAYRYSGQYDERQCKHIVLVNRVGCFGNHGDEQWDSEEMYANGVELLSTTHDTINELCPGCSMPMITIRTPL